MSARPQLRRAHAARVLVSASRRNDLLPLDATLKEEREIKTKVRDREDALASTPDACAAQNFRCNDQ